MAARFAATETIAPRAETGFRPQLPRYSAKNERPDSHGNPREALHWFHHVCGIRLTKGKSGAGPHARGPQLYVPLIALGDQHPSGARDGSACRLHLRVRRLARRFWRTRGQGHGGLTLLAPPSRNGRFRSNPDLAAGAAFPAATPWAREPAPHWPRRSSARHRIPGRPALPATPNSTPPQQTGAEWPPCQTPGEDHMARTAMPGKPPNEMRISCGLSCPRPHKPSFP